MEPNMLYFLWGGLFVVTVVLEIASQQLISIWFSAGALAAFLALFFGGSVVVQTGLFLLISLVLLLLTRPIVKRIFSFGIQDTNTQEIGRIATVIQPIDPIQNTGRVRLDGVDWLAVSQNQQPIPEHTSVRIEAVKGTRLIVTPLTEKATVNCSL